jgi:hypothetical protein
MAVIASQSWGTFLRTFAVQTGRWTLANSAAFYAGCVTLNTFTAPPTIALLVALLVAGAGVAYVLHDNDAAYALLLFVTVATCAVQWSKHGPAGLVVLALAAVQIAALTATVIAVLVFRRQTDKAGRL